MVSRSGQRHVHVRGDSRDRPDHCSNRGQRHRATTGTATDSDSQTSTPTTTESTSEADSSGGTTSAAVCPEDCADKGGTCIGGECCPTDDRTCGDVCCPDGGVCSFNTCVTPGQECIDASECTDEEYCEYSLGSPEMMGGMCQGGVVEALI